MKEYIEPEIEIIEYSVADVIASSKLPTAKHEGQFTDAEDDDNDDFWEGNSYSNDF